MMLTCYDVADYLLSRSKPEEGDLVSPLKLQKLVYYAQVINLALHGRAMFPESVLAWKHGPVVAELYYKYRALGDGAITAPEALGLDKYGVDDMLVLDQVFTSFGQFSAWKLRDMTHEEGPWKDTLQSQAITHEAMTQYGAMLLGMLPVGPPPPASEAALAAARRYRAGAVINGEYNWTPQPAD